MKMIKNRRVIYNGCEACGALGEATSRPWLKLAGSVLFLQLLFCPMNVTANSPTTRHTDNILAMGLTIKHHLFAGEFLRMLLTKRSAAAVVAVKPISCITLTSVVVDVCPSYTCLLTTAIVVVTRIQRCQHKHNLFRWQPMTSCF